MLIAMQGDALAAIGQRRAVHLIPQPRDVARVGADKQARQPLLDDGAGGDAAAAGSDTHSSISASRSPTKDAGSAAWPCRS